MNRTPRVERGFSLIELMVTLAVIVILAAVVTPSFRDVTRRNQVGNASNTLLAAVSYARTEAITRGNFVSICPSTDGASCATSTNYAQGWLVYTYAPGNGKSGAQYSASSGDVLLRSAGAMTTASIVANSSDVLSFGQQGQVVLASGKPLPSFLTCYKDPNGNKINTASVPGYQLTVNGSGGVTSTGLTAGASCGS